MADISKITALDGNTYDLKDATARGDLAGKAGKEKSFSVTLAANGWSNNAQSVTNSNFIVSGYDYIVAPSPSSFKAYAEAQIYADDVTTASTMTFHCEETPSASITVYVARMEAQ